MWFAIRTKPGQEESVRQQVRDRMSGEHWDNCKVLYCACKKRYLGAWHEERALFLPGYLFWVAEDWKDGWKNFGHSKLSLVGRHEEEFLKRITDGRDEIGMSYGVIQGGVLKISKGAMVGMENRVTKIDRHKRKGYIRLRIDEEERVAEIGLEITQKSYAAGKRV